MYEERESKWSRVEDRGSRGYGDRRAKDSFENRRSRHSMSRSVRAGNDREDRLGRNDMYFSHSGNQDQVPYMEKGDHSGQGSGNDRSETGIHSEILQFKVGVEGKETLEADPVLLEDGLDLINEMLEEEVFDVVEMEVELAEGEVCTEDDLKLMKELGQNEDLAAVEQGFSELGDDNHVDEDEGMEADAVKDFKHPGSEENVQLADVEQDKESKDEAAKKQVARKRLFKTAVSLRGATSKQRMVKAILSPRKKAGSKHAPRPGDGGKQEENKGTSIPNTSIPKP
ncbi:unnamed protein product [Eruca vesicaria subsp. sativa]|uniref:Uncharacterized protein n=1 Tax=Eruca vesicaria subsp. sativa TaxID=29727 RepID=A0ABC8KCE1_ERUVS|nr:unnamed protein product [Eruca vesicaria subsp. sativa]